MREILFRGKTLTDKWVEGAYYKQEEFYGDKEEAHIIITSKETLDNDFALESHIVIPETIGQYTGLVDKHGNKIFEGDIIKQNSPYRDIVSVIEYGVGYAYSNAYGVCQKFRDGSGSSLLSVVDESGRVYCEVIGNIHDTPELLEG